MKLSALVLFVCSWVNPAAFPGIQEGEGSSIQESGQESGAGAEQAGQEKAEVAEESGATEEAAGANPEQDAPTETPPFDTMVPDSVLMYAEFAGWDAAAERIATTALGRLFQHEEVVRLFQPTQEKIADHLQWWSGYLQEEMGEELEPSQIEVVKNFLADPSLGTVSVALFDFNPESEDVSFAASVELPGNAAGLFDVLAQTLREDETLEGSFEERTDGARQVLAVTDEDPTENAEFTLEGKRLTFTFGETAFDQLFGQAQSMADAGWYRTCKERLGQSDPLAFALVRPKPFVEAIEAQLEDFNAELTQAEEVGEELRRSLEFSRRVATESKPMQGFEAVASSWTVDGGDLVESLFFYMTNTEEWFTGLPTVGVAEDHAAMADPQSDVFATFAVDWVRAREISAAEIVRQRSLAEELGIDPDEYELEDPWTQMFGFLKDSLGIDGEERLMRALGPRASVWLDVPSGLTAIPPAGLIVDVADGAALDSLIEELLGQDEQIQEVDLSTSEYKGHRVITATLRNAGLPILPSLARIGEQCMVTLTPQALKSCIRHRENQDALAQSERFKPYRIHGEGRSMIGSGWVSMPAVVGWAYFAASTALSLVPPEQLGGFEPSLLPSMTTVAEHFGDGLVRWEALDDGWRIESRSTVGNPALGLVALVGGAAGYFGLEMGLAEGVLETKQEIALERMDEIASALTAYKSSVGGGAYPESLVQLLDRGFLEDPELLIDPADPKPKKVRSATGERIPLSFSLGKFAIFQEGAIHFDAHAHDDEEENDRLKPRPVIYSRGAWYDSWDASGGRLVYDIESGFHRVVPESEWQQREQ